MHIQRQFEWQQISYQNPEGGSLKAVGHFYNNKKRIYYSSPLFLGSILDKMKFMSLENRPYLVKGLPKLFKVSVTCIRQSRDEITLLPFHPRFGAAPSLGHLVTGSRVPGGGDPRAARSKQPRLNSSLTSFNAAPSGSPSAAPAQLRDRDTIPSPPPRL